MGRHSKTVRTADGLDRRQTGYYATPDFVARFLTQRMLAVNPAGKRVLDPCVGREEMLAAFAEAGKRIDGFDVLDLARPGRSRFKQTDFLEAYLAWRAQARPKPWPYDYYIANPPYNCHEADYIRRNKARLLAAFGDVGVDNMYSLFMAALLDVAKPGAVIGLLTLDSFLTARAHAPLRRRLVAHAGVHFLGLCPTDLFRDQGADVRTCLLVVQKESVAKKTALLNRAGSSTAFAAALAKNKFEQVPPAKLRLDEATDEGEIVVGCPADVRKLFALPRLGSIYPCLTGISTGNDQAYVTAAPAPGQAVPFYKNPGSRRFWAEPDGYLPDDFRSIAARVPNFIVRNKAYLLREGISCSSMGVPFAAVRLPQGAAFGVNANLFPGEKDRDWLLAYLNSRLVTFLVRGVLLRTNMITSGYVARIPLVPFTGRERAALARLARAAVATRRSSGHDGVLQRIDAIVYRAANLGTAARNRIDAFCADLVRLA